MRLSECAFQDYYHQYMVFEVDALTERFSDVIRVDEWDSYALCTCGVDRDGRIVFPVLSIGTQVDQCTKGLRRKQMLGFFDLFELYELDFEMIEPTWQMIRKTSLYSEGHRAHVSQEVQSMRLDERLNAVRILLYPDHVLAGVITDVGIQEVPVKLLGYNGPFVEGRIARTTGIKGLKRNELVRALPYGYPGQERLLSVFIGNQLSEHDEEAYQELIEKGNAYGFGFAKEVIKN